MLWIEQWKISIDGNLSLNNVVTLVNQVECEIDINNTKRKNDLENGLKEK